MTLSRREFLSGVAAAALVQPSTPNFTLVHADLAELEQKIIVLDPDGIAAAQARWTARSLTYISQSVAVESGVLVNYLYFKVKEILSADS